MPEIALQELLVNALVHRDYFTSASIRILVFTDRIDIISPGHLPDSLRVDDIRHGKANRRNPTLSEHAFRLLPYRGLGSGIPRALDEWPRIELIDETSGNQFTARVLRPGTQWNGAAAPVAPQVADPVTDPVTDPVLRLLQTLVNGPLAPSEIQERLTLKHRPTFRANYLRPALERLWIEPTLPGKPNSRLQQYRLTDRGRAQVQ